MTETFQHSIAREFPYQSKLMMVLLIVAFGLLVFGLYSPVLTLTKLWIFENTISILSGLEQLFENGNYLLFILIAGFSVILPIFKLIILYYLTAFRFSGNSRLNRVLQLMHKYGRWAMLDVFVVAILIVTVKLGMLADAEMRYGLYAFTAAIMITMIVTAHIEKLIARLDDGKN